MFGAPGSVADDKEAEVSVESIDDSESTLLTASSQRDLLNSFSGHSSGASMRVLYDPTEFTRSSSGDSWWTASPRIGSSMLCLADSSASCKSATTDVGDGSNTDISSTGTVGEDDSQSTISVSSTEAGSSVHDRQQFTSESQKNTSDDSYSIQLL